MHRWRPTHCTLQLNFLRPSECGEGQPQVLRAGDAYSGTSTIRYLRCDSKKDGGSTSPAVGSPTRNEPNVAIPRKEDGLHFHAITNIPHSLPKALPLTLQSMKVQMASQRSGAVSLKVLKVVDESNSISDGNKNNSGTGPTGASRSDKHVKNCEARKREKQSLKKQQRCKNSDEHNSMGGDGSCEQQADDPGSKYVYFEGGADMPAGSTVLLSIAFTGRVQAWDQGGIYAGEQKEGGAGSRVLLTHFEVALARLAFPCPDDPQEYRIVWQLQLLQLPAEYNMVVSNTTEITKKAVGSRGMQYSFAPIGPLPAYVIAFAAFAGTVEVLEEDLQLRGLPAVEYIEQTTSGKSLSAHDGRGNHAMRTVTMRVVTHATSGVTPPVLAQVAHTARDAIRLLEDFFDSPIPLQQLPFCSSHSSNDHWGSDYYCCEWQQYGGGETLTIVVAPTMPYISGMEHHGCIFLNESIYSLTQSVGGTGARGASRSNAPGSETVVEVERVELIVHELVHHWVGNALGMPFVLKEGVCQLMEQCLGDVIMGRPMRKVRPAATGANTTASNINTDSTKTRADDTNLVIVDAEKGKEFTFHSYQKALNTLRNVVSVMGFNVFKERMQRMYASEVLEDARSKTSSLPPYVSATKFMAYMNPQDAALYCT